MESWKLEEGVTTSNGGSNSSGGWSPAVKSLLQKVIAELMGTYFLIFAGCGVLTVEKIYGSVTFPGIAVTWGLTVSALIYALSHVSGAHFNPAVTIALTLFRLFPCWKQATLYVVAQFVGALLASLTLVALFDVTPQAYFGTLPIGSHLQSFGVEIIITSLLVFVICGVNTDPRAKGGFEGVAVGMTIMLNVFIAGPVSGASMNPARSVAPAIVKSVYKGIWVYIAGPIVGAMVGAFIYHLLRSNPDPTPLPQN
ncbi:probable aquaporin NIP-type [Prosopis cineraria]|uniref:probable aquaporin NIP-type n=1 Tax=Prosopis cineraria TaxID=364024 RepID=UPI00240FB8C3|nr:probable aquaporin NIP-type [Prosopis cineraria]